jgi:hypothetical protein
MIARTGLLLVLATALAWAARPPSPAEACCPAPPSGKPVVNADQTVLLIWDPATKTQHFIRQASFHSAADDFGFLVPTPSQPELDESGNEAFGFLLKLTEPEIQRVARPRGGSGCGCGVMPMAAPNAAVDESAVRVLQQKLVAGFQAVVLEAKSAESLVGWLRDNGYAFSPAIEAWARPYVEAGWKITALKVAKDKQDPAAPRVAASALRMTFKTDRPLFPYREPDSASAAQALGARHRLLRIYFVGEARYQGELAPGATWASQVAWAGKVSAADRTKALGLLKLPETAGPADWWLTEFEHDWPYQIAPADVTFVRSDDQRNVRRPPIIQYVATPWPGDVMACALAGVVLLPPLLRRARRPRAAKF